MSKEKVRVVRSFDALPPIVFAEGEAFSTRVLSYNYRKMEDALKRITEISHSTYNYEKMEGTIKKIAKIANDNKYVYTDFNSPEHKLEHVQNVSSMAIPKFEDAGDKTIVSIKSKNTDYYEWGRNCKKLKYSDLEASNVVNIAIINTGDVNLFWEGFFS